MSDLDIEMVYADGDDFHKLQLLMVKGDLRVFIDGEEKQIVGKIWIGSGSGISDWQPEEQENSDSSRENQGGPATYGGL